MKPKLTVENVIIMILRICVFPFIAGIAAVYSIFLYLKFLYNFIVYGGELIGLTGPDDKKKISDIYEILKKQHESGMLEAELKDKESKTRNR